MSKVTIIGSASWGTALGIALAREGNRVKLWAKTEEEAGRMNDARENTTFLPGHHFPIRLSATSSLEEAFEGSALAILAVPAQTMRHNVRQARDYINDSMLIVSAAKGLEVDSGKRMSQVIAEEIDGCYHPNICVLSGPNIAQETAQRLYSRTIVAANDTTTAEKAKEILDSSYLCVSIDNDVVGVELGGALKNVIALGSGITDGLGYGNNAKAAFITQGLEEITALGVAMGATPSAFTGLACLGDIIVTSFSPFSRNHYVGVQLAEGHSLREIVDSMPHVAEGIATTLAVHQLAEELHVDMPATEQIYGVLYEGKKPDKAIAELIGRPTEELRVSLPLSPLTSWQKSSL